MSEPISASAGAAPDGAAETITDDDEAIRAALEWAELAPLVACCAYLTADTSLLRDDLRPDQLALLSPDAGATPEQQAAARAIGFDVIGRLRDGSLTPPAHVDDETLSAILEFLVGEAQHDYLPLFREELAIGDEDLRAPGWRLDEVAPDRAMRVAVIGAGMSGLLAAHRLQQAGIHCVVIEKNVDVGGTWFENTYPGCRVDVPNHFYSYSFVHRDDWPQHFSTQQVLLDYFRDCAEQWGVRDAVRFGTEVTEARWDEDRAVWVVGLRSVDGDSAAASEEVLEVDALISAVGQLNRPSFPDIAGRERFAGPSFHSAAWDHTVDLTGKRVAVIGTGASALQFVPAIAPVVAEELVFQRTPPWLVPSPDYYADVEDGLHWLFRHLPSYARWYRFWLFWRNCEGLRPTAMVDPEWQPQERSVSAMNELVRELLEAYLTEQFGDDPDLLAAVTPDYPPIAKRVIRDDGTWARTLRRDNLSLITTGIAEITEHGVRTVDGVEHAVDVIVYGTGFTASDFLTPMRVYGRDGVELHDRWAGDARAYLGITVPEFPNLFCLYGPNTNIVINGSIIYFSECEVRYVLGCLRLLAETGHASLDCRAEVHDAFNVEIDEANRLMAWGASSVNSWYKNAKGRVAQNWPHSLLEYWQRTRVPDPADFELR